MVSYDKSKEITHLASFGIVLIVLGHSYITLDIRGEPVISFLYWLRRLIYSFHVPLFVFVSGFLFMHTNMGPGNINYRKFIAKKIRRLIVPYLAINTVVFPLKAALSLYAWNPLALDLTTYLTMMVYPSRSPVFFLWFLPTLFAIFLAAPLMRGVILHPKRIIIIPTLTLLLLAVNMLNPAASIKLFNLSKVAELTVYFWFGCLFCVFKNTIHLRFKRAMSFLLLVLLIISVSGSGSSAHRLISAISGIVVSYSLIRLYTRKSWTWLRLIDGYSYQIYLLSWFPQVFFRIVFDQILGLSFYLCFISMFLAGLILPIAVTAVVKRRLPWMKLLLGI